MRAIRRFILVKNIFGFENILQYRLNKEEEDNNEKDISTQKTQKKERAWLSEKNENNLRKEHRKEKKTQRKNEINSLGIHAERLRSRRDFELVFSSGRKTVTSDFALHSLPVSDSGLRIGICVGKSLGCAVKRNRTRRRIREIIRQIDFKQNNLDLVIVTRRKSMDKDFHYIKEKILEILLKARLI